MRALAGDRRGASALLAVAVMLAVATRARAEPGEPEPAVALSVATGTGLALGSLAIGSFEFAAHDDQHGRKLGAYTVLYGLTLAPFASHALAGEWTRAAAFTALPFASSVAATWLIETSPSLLVEGGLGKRRALTLCYSLALLSAAIGLYDSMHAGERARAARLTASPLLGHGQLGLAVGGRL